MSRRLRLSLFGRNAGALAGSFVPRSFASKAFNDSYSVKFGNSKLYVEGQFGGTGPHSERSYKKAYVITGGSPADRYQKFKALQKNFSGLNVGHLKFEDKLYVFVSENTTSFYGLNTDALPEVFRLIGGLEIPADFDQANRRDQPSFGVVTLPEPSAESEAVKESESTVTPGLQ